MINKISIGTAQFGSAYGIANKVGEVSEDQVLEILDEARLRGICKLDTAPTYGNSETKLGKCGVKDFSITTKLSNINSDVKDVRGYVHREIGKSLRRLRVNYLDVVLFHNELNLKTQNGYLAYRALDDLKTEGVIKKIGVSTYFSRSLESILREYEFQTIQLPYNVVDRRFESFNSRFSLQNFDIQARSLFLQGLLLIEGDEAEKNCRAWIAKKEIWRNFLNKSKLTAYEAALFFGLSNRLVDTFVIGLDGLAQLQNLCKVLESFNFNIKYLYEELESNDESILNPFAWKKIDE